MPTYGELSRKYAEKVSSAAKRTHLTKSARFITESQKQDKLVAALQEIWRDLERYRISDEDRDTILRMAGRELGLEDPGTFVILVKEASNENFVALANYWSTFFAELD